MPLPDHMTIDMEPEDSAAEPPLDALDLDEMAAVSPPPTSLEAPAAQDVTPSPELEVSSDDLAALASAEGPAEPFEMAESVADTEAESIDTTAWPLQDVALVAETPAGPDEPDSEPIDAALPTIELFDSHAALIPVEAEPRAAAPEVELEAEPEAEEVVSAALDGAEVAGDDAVFTAEVDVPSRHDELEIVGLPPTPVAEPPLEEASRLPAFDLAPDAPDTEVEMTLPELDVPMLDDTILTFADEDVPRTPPASAPLAATGDPTHEDALPSSGMFAAEELEESPLSEHFTLDLDALDLPTELMSGPFADVEHTPPQEDTAAPTAPPGADPDLVLTSLEALPFEEPNETTPPGHLTLELDASALMADLSSITSDDSQPAHVLGDMTANTSPPENPVDGEEALLLDLDDIELDEEDERA